jgi:hypothetical protein
MGRKAPISVVTILERLKSLLPKSIVKSQNILNSSMTTTDDNSTLHSNGNQDPKKTKEANRRADLNQKSSGRTTAAQKSEKNDPSKPEMKSKPKLILYYHGQDQKKEDDVR